MYNPRKNEDKPTLVVELKSNRSARAAISQIRHGIYDLPIFDLLFDRNGAAQIVNRKFVNSKFVNSKYNDILLVGINYDKKKKRHTCRIERWKKDSPSA